MKLPTGTIVRALTVAAFALGVGLAACEKQSSSSPDDGQSKSDGGGNLCTEYTTCDACISGQVAKGKSEGSAETECGAAVLGCWTTWDKPITCNGKEQEGPKS